MTKHKLGLCLMALFCCQFALWAKTVRKMEPAFWWAGMKEPQLQILLTGDNLATADITVVGNGVKVDSVVKPTNASYAILYVDIRRAQPQTLQLCVKKAGRRAETYPYELRARTRKGHAQGFTERDVVYLLMPDRFANGDTTNDVVSGMRERRIDRNGQYARHGGDLRGIIRHLDYLNDLGVTALWLNPTQENDMPEGSYHGYAVTDYYRTDRRLGSNEEFCELVDEAHRRGMKIIMDMIFNHCGSRNPLFTDRPSDDWFNYGSQYVQTTFKTATALDKYASVADKRLAVDGWFTESMPDWNQRNPHVAKYLIQTSVFWIEYAGIDGIRQDTHPYADFDFMARWCRTVMNEYPDFNIVGETWLNSNVQIAYWQRNSRLSARNSHLPTVMDFPLFMAMGRAFDENTGEWEGGLFRLYDLLSQDFVYEDPSRLFIFLDNHDTSRFLRNADDVRRMDRYKQALTFLLTTRGIPQLYYGMEILMSADKSEGDGCLRRDFPGGWTDDARNAFVSEGRTEAENSAFDFMRRLLQWRKSHSDAVTGRLVQFAVRKGVYAYARLGEKERILVLMNGTDSEQPIDWQGYAEVLKEGKKIDVLTGKTLDLSQKNSLKPREVVLINY